MNQHTTLIRRAVDAILPIPVEERLRRLLVDKFTGNVQLNIKDGVIRGFTIEEKINLPAA